MGYRFHLIRHEKTDDFIHDGELPGIYTSLELYLGIVSACLPLLSPPIATMATSISQSRLLSYLAAHSTVFGRSRSTMIPSKDDSSQIVGDNYPLDGNHKHTYRVSTLHDEEDVPGTGAFMTVPPHWPSDER